MQSTVRKLNEARARNSLLRNRVMSRADLARDLHLTRATASSIVSALIDAGEVIERPDSSDQNANKTGRPAVQLRLNGEHAFFLGAYIGATRIYLCAVDFAGTSRHLSERDLTPEHLTPQGMVAQLAAMIDAFLADGVRADRIYGLAVAVPGVVDMQGNVLRAPPLGWVSVPLMRIIADALPSVPVVSVLNDASAFAIAAQDELDDEDLNDALFILLEDGIGGCIVSDGRTVNGRDGFAGEFGHIPVGKNGFFSLTGIEGALENFVSRGAVLARYRAVGGTAARFGDFLAHLSSGDARAMQVQSECIHYFARGLLIGASLLNPTAFVIGGRVSGLFHTAQDTIADILSAQLIQGTSVPKILMSSVTPEGPATGAALTLQKAVFAYPTQTGLSV